MSARDRVPALLRRPEQGWSSLAFLLGMLVLVGVSVANARPMVPVAGGPSLTSSLAVLLLAAGVMSYMLARSGIGVVRAHLLGAMAGALLLLWTAGGVILQGDPSIAPEAAMSDRVGAVWVYLEADVQASMSGATSTPVVTYLLLGSILWTTAQFSAFSVFRYDRGGPAVAAMGTVLFLNIGLGSAVPDEELLPVLPLLALFSAMAMALLIRMQLLQQRQHWVRRHIADAGEVQRLFMRSGALFVAITVISASSLTAVATVEPLRMPLDQLEEPLEDFGDQIARWLGLVGVPAPDSVPPARGRETEIWSSWTPGEGTAFTAFSQSSIRSNYWWGWADDEYVVDDGVWRRHGEAKLNVSAGEQLPFPLSDGPTYETEVTMVLGDATPATARRHLFRLAEAASVRDEDVLAYVVDDGRHASDIHWDSALGVGDEVSVVSYVHDYDAGGEGVSANQLRRAGTAYPDWLTPKYLQGRGDERINGPGVQALVSKVTALAEDNPYDQALALQDEFRSGDYAYVVEVDCSAHPSIPECVLAEQRGFCTHYATTMTMALREMGIPSRFVTGYLPGEYDPASGVWTVEQAALHNWVEVYFPGYGWIRFDPTPGREYGQAPTRLRDGEELPSEELATLPPEPAPSGLEPTPEPSEEAIVPTTPTGGGPDTIYLVVSIGAIVALVLAVVGSLLLSRLRRLPGGDEGLAYRGIVSLATRLGHGPHPSQTEYEYAGTLSETLPAVREDLYLVADARVETAYGRRQLDRERRGLLRGAYSRIRTALLRLSLRRH